MQNSANDPLAQLRDIHLPESVGWWPPAPGWWILAVAVIGLSLFLIVRLVNHQRRQAYRRTARREIQALQLNAAALAPVQVLQGCNALLKRTAKQAYPEFRSESLSGQQWLRFLHSSCPDPCFTDNGEWFGDGLYQASIECDKDQILAETSIWINKHYNDLSKFIKEVSEC